MDANSDPSSSTPMPAKQYLVQLANNPGMFYLSTASSLEMPAAVSIATVGLSSASRPSKTRKEPVKKLDRKSRTRLANLPKLETILEVNPFQFPRGALRDEAWDRVIATLCEKGLAKQTEKDLRNAQLCVWRSVKEYAAKLREDGADLENPPVSGDTFDSVVRGLYLADSKPKKPVKCKADIKVKKRKRRKGAGDDDYSADEENDSNGQNPVLDEDYRPLPGNECDEQEEAEMEVDAHRLDHWQSETDDSEGLEAVSKEDPAAQVLPGLPSAISSGSSALLDTTSSALITAQAGSSIFYILRTTDPFTGQTSLQALSSATVGLPSSGVPGITHQSPSLSIASSAQKLGLTKLPIPRTHVPVVESRKPTPVQLPNLEKPVTKAVVQPSSAVASRTRLASAKYVVVKQTAPIKIPKEAFQKKPDKIEIADDSPGERLLCRRSVKREETAVKLQAVLDAGVFFHKNNSRAKGEAWTVAARIVKQKLPSSRTKTNGAVTHALEVLVNNYLNRVRKMIRYGEITEGQEFTTDLEQLAKKIYDLQKTAENGLAKEAQSGPKRARVGDCGEVDGLENGVAEEEEPRNETDWRTGLFWCKDCSLCLDEPCLTHSNIVGDQPFLPRALVTLPSCLYIDTLTSKANWTVVAKTRVAVQTIFGPLVAPRRTQPDINEIRYGIQTADGILHHFRLADDDVCNWMKYVKLARSPREQNLAAYCQDDCIYFATTRVVAAEEELRVWYSRSYGSVMGKGMLAEEDKGVVQSAHTPRRKATRTKATKHQAVPVDDIPMDTDTDWSPTEPAGRDSDSDYEPATPEPRSSPSKAKRDKSSKKSVEPAKKFGPVRKPYDGLGRKQRNPWTRTLPGLRRAREEAKKGALSRIKRPSVPLYKKNCSTCGLIFRADSVLKIHEMRHEEDLVDDGTVEKKCPICFLVTDSLEKLFDHVDRHSKKPSIYHKKTNFPCNVCRHHFASQKHLDTHIRRMHTECAVAERVFECNICHEKLLTKAGLTSHVKIHQDKNYYECPVCLLSFTFGYQLQDHSESHCVDGKFPCRLCTTSFDNFGQLKRHLRLIHKPKNVPCEICGETFKSNGRLAKHKVVHSNAYDFVCAICGKKYKTSHHLRQHMKIHDPNKVDRRKVPREDGAPSSTRKGYVPPRQRMLYEDFPYKCEECRTGFLRRGMLTTHLQMYHPEIPLDTVPEHVERTFEAFC